MVYLPNSTNIREIKFQTVAVKREKLSQAKYSNLAHLIKVCDISQWIWVLNRRLFFISMLEPFLRKIAPTPNLKQFHISNIIKTNYCIQEICFLLSCSSTVLQCSISYLEFINHFLNC